jgi:hypothetical protein
MADRTARGADSSKLLYEIDHLSALVIRTMFATPDPGCSAGYKSTNITAGCGCCTIGHLYSIAHRSSRFCGATAPSPLFMSLIHTSELNGANPFHYLTELLRHSEELKQRPPQWMPWNYHDTLVHLTTPAAA